MSTEQLSGDITIKLNGEEHTLRPSLQAATALSSQFEGLSKAYTGILNRDLLTFQAVVRAGIITEPKIPTKELNEAVYRAGMANLSGGLIDFLAILNNGGRVPGEDGADKAGGDSDGDGEGNGHGE